ncbi:MAG: tRNA (adenosine(37)-N6)-dimethylallyltransferase MiaA [Ruthenibacterium sp.]
MADKAELLVICGPTATGKTSLSVALAKQMNSEIICADSMQIYQNLSIGTARVTTAEMQGVPHHLVGFLSPDVRFSVADYVKMAQDAIADITARGKLPIVVGGTGLYIKSLVEGIQFAAQKTDLSVREDLQTQLDSVGIMPLYARLLQVDPQYGNTIHPNNHGRVLRALELYLQTGKTMSQQLAASRPPERPYQDVLIGLQYATREILYSAINTRVDTMMQQGLLNEAEQVFLHRDSYVTAAQAIGYKELFPYFTQTDSLQNCVEKLKQSSRNYAKRQITWFARMEHLLWLPANETGSAAQVLKIWNETKGSLK